MAYAELDITTNFTFLTGASHPAELVAQAKMLGLTTIGIADFNTLSGIVRAYAAAKDAGQDLRVGSRLCLRNETTLLCYPKTLRGYSALSQLLTLGKRRAPKGECHLDLSDVIEMLEDCVVILIDPVFAQTDIPALKTAFGPDLYLGLSVRYDGWDERRLTDVAALAKLTKLPLVSLGGVLMHSAARRKLADVLSCIRLGVKIDALGLDAQLNAEARLKSEHELRRLFRAYPEAMTNTLRIAERCTFRLDEIQYQYPDEVLNGIDPDTRLRQLTKEGLLWRYPGGVPLKTRALVEKELGLVKGPISFRYRKHYNKL